MNLTKRGVLFFGSNVLFRQARFDKVDYSIQIVSRLYHYMWHLGKSLVFSLPYPLRKGYQCQTFYVYYDWIMIFFWGGGGERCKFPQQNWTQNVPQWNFIALHKLVKKVPCQLQKVFQKVLNIVQIKVHQEKQTHPLLILIPNL